jgi:enoyl-CoA hydratase/carnithine racemase
MTAIVYETNGPLAVITMTHEPHNLLGPDLMQPLLAALQRASSHNARAVLLKSGLRHFSAGADLALFANRNGGETFDALATLRAFESHPLPVVCAVHGLCLAGGLELALACDYLVAARSARLGAVEATIGLHPLMGAVQRVTQRAGALRAKEMAMLGRRYDPDTLAAWGLVNLVVNDEDLDDTAQAIGLELANGPTVAHTATKALVSVAVNDGVAAADEAMKAVQQPIWASEDLTEGLRSFSANGPGAARFVGR